MDFERGIAPVKALNIGKERKIFRLDSFEVEFPGTPDYPSYKQNAIALSDEEEIALTTFSGLSGASRTEFFRSVQFSTEDQIGEARFEKERWIVQ